MGKEAFLAEQQQNKCSVYVYLLACLVSVFVSMFSLCLC